MAGGPRTKLGARRAVRAKANELKAAGFAPTVIKDMLKKWIEEKYKDRVVVQFMLQALVDLVL
jgi:hypothetical protein